MNWEAEFDMFLMVRLAKGLWVNPEDVSAIQDRKTGENRHTNVILRNGVTVALAGSSAERVVEKLGDAARLVQRGQD